MLVRVVMEERIPLMAITAAVAAVQVAGQTGYTPVERVVERVKQVLQEPVVVVVVLLTSPWQAQLF